MAAAAVATAGADLELRLKGAVGIPKGSLVSVRIGSVRRQAPYGSDRPYRFPALSGKKEQMKVDIYAPLAHARLFVDGTAPARTWEQPLHQAVQAPPGLDDSAEDGCFLTLELAPGVGAAASNGSAHKRPRGATATPTVGASGRDGRELELSESELSSPMLPVQQRGVTPSAASATAKRHQVALEVQPYFEEHDVLEVMQKLLSALIKERPADPFGYMIQVLESTRAANAGPRPPGKRPQTAPLGGRAPQEAPIMRSPGGSERRAAAGPPAGPPLPVPPPPQLQPPEPPPQLPARPPQGHVWLPPQEPPTVRSPFGSERRAAAPPAPGPLEQQPLAPPQLLPPPRRPQVGLSAEELEEMRAEVRRVLIAKQDEGQLAQELVRCRFGDFSRSTGPALGPPAAAAAVAAAALGAARAGAGEAAIEAATALGEGSVQPVPPKAPWLQPELPVDRASRGASPATGGAAGAASGGDCPEVTAAPAAPPAAPPALPPPAPATAAPVAADEARRRPLLPLNSRAAGGPPAAPALGPASPLDESPAPEAQPELQRPPTIVLVPSSPPAEVWVALAPSSPPAEGATNTAGCGRPGGDAGAGDGGAGGGGERWRWQTEPEEEEPAVGARAAPPDLALQDLQQADAMGEVEELQLPTDRSIRQAAIDVSSEVVQRLQTALLKPMPMH